MFYTLQQNRRLGGYPEQRFICFEADTMSEARQRAIWFGIDMEENIPGSLINRWGWVHFSCNVSHPEFDGYPFADGFPFTGRWVILYKNNNMKTSDEHAFSSEWLDPEV